MVSELRIFFSDPLKHPMCNSSVIAYNNLILRQQIAERNGAPVLGMAGRDNGAAKIGPVCFCFADTRIPRKRRMAQYVL